MASQPPQRAMSLAQSIDEGNLDGSVTWDETISSTEGMKVVFMEKPVVVNKEPGHIQIGNLPARDTILSSDGRATKKKLQFLDVILGHEGEINLPLLEQMFLQGRCDDLPAPIKMKGENITPYTMQVFISKKESTHDIVKHVRFADNTKVLDSVIVNMCSGQPLEVDYQKQGFAAHARRVRRGFWV